MKPSDRPIDNGMIGDEPLGDHGAMLIVWPVYRDEYDERDGGDVLMCDKTTEEKPAPRIIWEGDTKEHRVRIVVCGKTITPERRLGKDAMGVEAWQFIQWGTWTQTLGEEYIQLLMKTKREDEDDNGDTESG